MKTLPCPFCGHNYIHVHVGSTRLHAVAVCGYCGARACQVPMTHDNWIINHSGIEEVYKEWNTRTELNSESVSNVITQRVAFEKWHGPYSLSRCNAPGDDLGDYQESHTNYAWKAWQAAQASTKPRCKYCDGTGLVHGLDGNLRGVCTQCDASKLNKF